MITFREETDLGVGEMASAERATVIKWARMYAKSKDEEEKR